MSAPTANNLATPTYLESIPTSSYRPRCSPHAPRAMNAVESLNLSTHDEGVAAIATFPVALDWLAIAFPPLINNTFVFPSFPSPSAHPSEQPLRPPTPPQDPITRRQAAAALVRHLNPSSCREVLAPCFCVDGRYILGRTLGNLYVPPELGIPQLATEPCADARFVLDLQNGSIVEVRQYPDAKALLCVAYASLRAEFLSLPPFHGSRVEMTYRRDQSASPPQPDFGHLFEHMPRAQGSWHQFCTNYGNIFPTGALTATVAAEPGPAVASFKNESIMVTYNDPYAMTFSHAQSSLRPGSQARRIAPKRLLPRPPP